MVDLTDIQKRRLIAAKRLQRSKMLNECFDASKLKSRSNEKQDSILQDTLTLYRIIRCGNQCLAEGTLVQTPEGNIPIESIKIGDYVLDEWGDPVRVLETFENGAKDVHKIMSLDTGKLLVECTLDHKLAVCRPPGPGINRDLTEMVIPVSEIRSDDWVEVYRPDSPHNQLDRISIEGTRTVTTYDLNVASDTNLYLVESGLILSNSGKTATMVRDYVWKMKETHPYWKRRSGDECPKCKCINTTLTEEMTETYQCDGCDYEWISWGTQGLTFLVVCQTGKHIDSIWKDRFKPFFADDEVKVDIKGGILQSVTHKKTGNTMIFFSHDNATEVRKRVQFFVAHDVWIDEMPSKYKVYEELMRRVDAMRGQFSATLTPKVSNIEVKEFIDKLDPSVHTLHRMNKLDNPVNARFKEQELAKLKSMDEATRNAVLYGDWVFAGELRLNIDMKQIRPLPEYYSRTWDHVVCIDPASAGKAGFVIFAKDPADVDTWWVVTAFHIKGDAPSTLVNEILPKHTVGLNIVKRVADPHETWFIKEASKSGTEYECPFDKTHRRKELLAGGEEALINPKMFFVEGETTKLVSELNSAVDDPKNPGNIKNATKYHCIDAWIYGLDLLPKYKTPPKPLTPGQQLKADWHLYKQGDRAAMEGSYGGQSAPTSPSSGVAASAKKAFAKNNTRWSRRR